VTTEAVRAELRQGVPSHPALEDALTAPWLETEPIDTPFEDLDHLDLLFFHRPLRALVAIELKLGRFDARDKGQMELYLRWLDRYERHPAENPPLGLILCADKNEKQVELLELDQGTVRVASYLTELPPRDLLERKLVESIAHARARALSRAVASEDDPQ